MGAKIGSARVDKPVDLVNHLVNGLLIQPLEYRKAHSLGFKQSDGTSFQ